MSNRGKRIMRELPILFNKEMVPQEKTPEGVFNRGSGIRTHDHAFIGGALYPLSYRTSLNSRDLATSLLKTMVSIRQLFIQK